MLSHIDEKGQPRMVDVGEKPMSRRSARARALIHIPDEVAMLIRDGALRTQKGPVFHTAIIAGVMAAKKTSELIPFCHPIGLDDCQVEITLPEPDRIQIDCVVSVYGKTGVEMEAMTGASVAALTVYDMCKAASHGIVIQEIRLMEKRGGRSDYAVR
ncbi:MAG: cyclic pyranopterin monophosphate synthase accessory protein 1 [Candidatus Hydrogenedentota bacterium]